MHLPSTDELLDGDEPLAVRDILLALARSKAGEINGELARAGEPDLRRLWTEVADLQALFAELVRLERGEPKGD